MTSITNYDQTAAGYSPKLSFSPKNVSDHFYKTTFLKIFRDLRHGEIKIRYPDGSQDEFGITGSRRSFLINVHSNGLFKKLLKGGPLALGESYMDGLWSVEGDNLSGMFELIFKNQIDLKAQRFNIRKLLLNLNPFSRQANNLSASKKNVSHHYDIGNDFYKLMLDESMQYSCGYALSPDDSLAMMQKQKSERICMKLKIREKEKASLLDVGCGWGGFLIHAAQRYPNLKCVGITLSEAQFRFAYKRIKDAGLSEQIELRLCDYREINGLFDHIVSIGMFEHVGIDESQTFMNIMHSLLKPSGTGLLHTIGVEEPPERPSDPWIDKYIFPGNRLPRLEEIASGMRRANLQIGHVENLRPHYALTIRRWKENFDANLGRIKELGGKYDLRFLKAWNYYLQICQANFTNSTMELYQVIFGKRGSWAFPLNFNF